MDHRRVATTPLCGRLGIDVPIVQAPIGTATTPELAAAVSNAGGLGTLALSWANPASTRERIRRTRALTGRPFAVNLVLHWDQRERLEICAQERVPIVSTFWGDPASYVGPIHDSGAVHIHTVGSVAEARGAVDAGVDILVAQGLEAGGHVRGETSIVALVPAIVDTVDSTPVLAAGGIADARGVSAALALGAQGAWVGTRFVVVAEANVHAEYRSRLIAANASDTLLCTVFDKGWPEAPHRTLRNSTVAAWETAGRPAAPNRPGEDDVIGASPSGTPLIRYGFGIPVAGTTGDVEAMAMYAGQGVGLIRAGEPAADVVRALTPGV
ncbi:MAG TPA: nitronate monooxygenase [Solirubrobacteraceae bacterium]|nr:nitronate monooxygenase [Solirubrobacteraceae bacterium]